MIWLLEKARSTRCRDSPMHISGIQVDQLPPLEHVRFNCNNRVNLFVGPNASGKSTILRAIREMYFLSDDHIDLKDVDLRMRDGQKLPYNEHLEFENSKGQLAVFDLEASDDWPRDQNLTKWQSVPLLYVPATRVNIPSQHLFDLQAVRSGPIRTQDSPYHRDIYYAQDVESFVEMLRGSLDSREDQFQLRKALDIGYSCAKEICREVIYDDRHHWMDIGTIDDYLGEPLYAGVLSAGTQGTLMWAWDLAVTMSCWRDFEAGWEEKPAILLIDEIDNHLHPTWQRRVIPSLLKHFPGLQIFATTHSPFVVAGLQAGQVHLLKRDENGVGAVTATTNTKNVMGWTADEILRTMMEVADPTDDRTAAAARELRQLRNGGPGDTEEAEQQRQVRMGELRKLVDRDLLAGGPWKKQRELFEQQFAETLKKYQQSQDLNQENG